MKIISCHIENFGKLQNYTLEFQPDCTRIFAPNGWGKSTLAAFLRVMLYGFEGEGKRTDLLNERKRFRPWNGGVYGGSMRFEANGKEYLVTRTFGEKEASDTFELRDAATNLKSSDFGPKLGEELFEINSESFLRTIYMGQDDLSQAGTTDGIHAKIGNLEADEADLKAYEQAEDQLKKYTDRLTFRRSTGELAKLSGEKTRLERVIAENAGLNQSVSQTADLLEKEQKEITELKERARELSAKQKEAGAQKDLQAKRETYRELLQQSLEKKQDAERAMADFPEGLPKEGAISQLFSVNAETEKYRQAEELYRLQPEEESVLRRYQKAFANGLPEDAFYSECGELVSELSHQKEIAAALRMTQEEEEKLEKLQGMFWTVEEPYKDPLEEAVAVRGQLLGKVEREEKLPEKKTKRKQLEETLQAEQHHKKGKIWIGLLIFAILLLAGALVTGILGISLGEVLLIIAASLGAGGILFLIIALMLRSSYKKPNETEQKAEAELAHLKSEIEDDEHFIVTAGITVHNYLKRHEESKAETGQAEEVVPTEGVTQTEELTQTEEMRMQQLLGDAMDYMTLSDKKAKAAEANADQKMTELEKTLRERLALYGLGNSLGRLNMTPSAYQMSLDSLERAAVRYQEVSLKKQNYEKNHQLFEDCKAKLRKGLLEIGISPIKAEEGDTARFLLELQEKEVRTRHLLEEAEAAEKKRIAYKEEYSAYPLVDEISCEPEKDPGKSNTAPGQDGQASGNPENCEEMPSLSELQEEYQQVQEKIEEKQTLIRHYISRMDVLGEEQDEWEENRRDLAALNEKIDLRKRQYELALKAAELLTKARTNITSRQMQPLMENFTKYAKVLTEENENTYHIDADANITRDELGQQRQPEYFSAGTRDLIGLCKRLAVADTMYPEQKPPLIMDDPFSNFDDQRMEGAKKLLAEAAENYQVIYFTCAEDRM